MGMKLNGFLTLDMFMDTWIHGFLIKFIYSKVNEYFIGILNSWISLPMKYTKLNL